MVETWKELKVEIEKEGISQPVMELIRRLTAPRRHEARARAAWSAALEWAGNDAAAAALCFAETRGLYGGGLLSPGAGTLRHKAFERLGKGRRKASDGDAWTAAISDAPGIHGWHLVGWETRLDGSLKIKVMASDVIDVDAAEILAWHELKTLTIGLVLDGTIDPVSAAPILEWCWRRSLEEDD